MKPEAWHAIAQDLRWRTAALVFALVAVVGAACAAWALHDLRGSSLRAAREDAQALAQSVAQTLAQQLGRAVRLGIPLAELPGVPAYLQAALQGRPALTHIMVEGADGRLLHAAGRDTRAGASDADAVRVPIAGAGAGATAPVATVVVGLDAGASVQRGLRQVWEQGAALVLALAGAAAVLAGIGPGAQMERQRRQVMERLQRCSLDDSAPPPAAELDDGDAGAGLPALARALEQGDAQLHAARRAVRDYAHELLAMDFDGRLRADIERCVPGSAAAPSPGG